MKAPFPVLGRTSLAAIFRPVRPDKVVHAVFDQNDGAPCESPYAGQIPPIAVAFEVVSGISIPVGYKARWGAIALAVFSIPTALAFDTHFTAPVR